MPFVRLLLVTSAMTWCLVACGGAAPDSAEDTSAPGTTARPTTPEDTMQPSTPAPQPGGAVDQAVADLAGRLGVEPDDVEVVATEEVTWSDGSRGCAKKGMNYTMSLIDGSRITLRVGGTTYEYHSGGSGGPFLCEQPTQ